VLSTQVLQELYVSLRQAPNPMPAAEARQVVADYLRWEVVVNNGDSVVEAAELETKYRISFWDALILQAASTSGARRQPAHRLIPVRSRPGAFPQRRIPPRAR